MYTDIYSVLQKLLHHFSSRSLWSIWSRLLLCFSDVYKQYIFLKSWMVSGWIIVQHLALWSNNASYISINNVKYLHCIMFTIYIHFFTIIPIILNVKSIQCPHQKFRIHTIDKTTQWMTLLQTESYPYSKPLPYYSTFFIINSVQRSE